MEALANARRVQHRDRHHHNKTHFFIALSRSKLRPQHPFCRNRRSSLSAAIHKLAGSCGLARSPRNPPQCTHISAGKNAVLPGGNEALSRVIIDALLADIGWDLADGRSARYEFLFPEVTRADYLLSDRHGCAFAVIDAKRVSVDRAAISGPDRHRVTYETASCGSAGAQAVETTPPKSAINTSALFMPNARLEGR